MTVYNKYVLNNYLHGSYCLQAKLFDSPLRVGRNTAIFWSNNGGTSLPTFLQIPVKKYCKFTVPGTTTQS